MLSITTTVTSNPIPQQTRLDKLKELTKVLLETLPREESLRLMEGLQSLAEVTEHRPAAMERHLEAVLRDYGIEI